MQKAERLRAIQPGAFAHKAVNELQHAIGAINKTLQGFTTIDLTIFCYAVIKEAFTACAFFCRRQIEKGKKIGRVKMNAFFLKLRFAFCINQCGGNIRKLAFWIG